ncbi:MAG: transglycosylase domain-containing protein, partial [Treponema sp.]|nr:transglycosylase domain-containing protein [Treponema sp.]
MGKRVRASLGFRIVVIVLAVFTALFAAVIGIGLGFAIAETSNVSGDFLDFTPALPSRVFDTNGELITVFAGEERRELVPLDELPRHLINAVLAREDIDFFSHRGFSLRGIGRAIVGQIQGVNRGGGSTITQQVAGTFFTNRREATFSRKARELWWALQLERHYSKNEILEIYMNYMVMGPGVFGVEAASRYFFGHSARDVTVAEAAMLAVQLSSPTHNNPFRNPDIAMDRQRHVLERMIEFGLASRDYVDASFDSYWENFDFERQPLGAFFHFRSEDRAPWFSEHVRRELEAMLPEQSNIFRDGLTVHTTMNMRHQEAAERHMAEGLARANSPNFRWLDRNWFDPEWSAESGFDTVQRMIRRGDPVEGALVTLENHTGRITALVGGSEFSQNNQFIRATQAIVQTGSSFKPLYFSAAVDARQVTAGTLIHDAPVAFHTEDGGVYVPVNYGGRWVGPILMHRALNVSLNIPALKVLDSVGIDAAVERSAALLGLTDP